MLSEDFGEFEIREFYQQQRDDDLREFDEQEESLEALDYREGWFRDYGIPEPGQ